MGWANTVLVIIFEAFLIFHEIQGDRLSDEVGAGVSHFGGELVGHVDDGEVRQLRIRHQKNPI